jgi:hypothetical protein
VAKKQRQPTSLDTERTSIDSLAKEEAVLAAAEASLKTIQKPPVRPDVKGDNSLGVAQPTGAIRDLFYGVWLAATLFAVFTAYWIGTTVR